MLEQCFVLFKIYRSYLFIKKQLYLLEIIMPNHLLYNKYYQNHQSVNITIFGKIRYIIIQKKLYMYAVIIIMLKYDTWVWILSMILSWLINDNQK